MGVDIIARAMAAAARSAGSGSATSVPIGHFTDLPSRTIDAAWSAVVTSGYSAAGLGGGIYVADSVANAALAAAHPRFCKADAAGRYFRLLPDDEGLIPVACGGADGLTAAPGDADAAVDERAIIQAAEDYRHAIGAAGLRFDARYYAFRRPTLPAGTNYYDFINHVAFVVQSASIWKSTHPAGTDIYRRKANGLRPDAADHEVTTGYGANFRGGCIWINGLGTGADPGPEANAFTLDGIRLQGGLLQSMPGLTFEILDKPVWQQNDEYGGNLTFRNRAGLIGFASELIYQACPNGPASVKRTVLIEDGCVFGETPGSAINASGTLRVGRCLIYNATVGIEGWLGEDGYLRAIFRNSGGSIQGGTVHQVSGEHYYTPTETGSGLLPVGNLDIRLEKCPAFSVGSWISGRIEAIDTDVSFGNAALFPKGSRDIDLEVISWVHSRTINAGVYFAGAEALGNRNISVRLSLKRTKEAQAGGFKHNAVIGGYGSLGPNVIVDVVSHYDEYQTLVAGDLTDWAPILRGMPYNEKYASPFYDIEANNGATLPKRPIVALSCSNAASGAKNANLPTSLINPGYRMTVANFTRNNVSPGLDVKINGSNFRSGLDENINGSYTAATFEWNGAKWRVVERV